MPPTKRAGLDRTGALIPAPAWPAVRQVPEIADPARRAYLTEIAADHAPPTRAVTALGPMPEDPLDWLAFVRILRESRPVPQEVTQ
jgi:hypothetical protein